MKLFNFWRCWLPLFALGLFISRCLYEWNPLQFAWLGVWWVVVPAVLAIVLLIRWLMNRARERSPDWLPPDLSPFLLVVVYLVWPSVDLGWALILLLGAAALFGARYLLPQRARWFDLAVGLLALALYLVTLGDHVGKADTFEFQVVAPQWGIAHPTGYPLFVLIGKLFSLLPIGSMAWRVNAASALFATIAIWLIYRTIVLLTSDRLSSAIAALTLAASPVFWSQAVVAEVYALNAALVAGAILLLLNLLICRPAQIGINQDERRDSSLPAVAHAVPAKRRRTGRTDTLGFAIAPDGSLRRVTPAVLPLSVRAMIFLLALTLGLAFSHHLTSVILIPPVVLTLILARPRLPRRAWLIACGLFLLGLTPWLLVYLRWPALHNGQWMMIGEWLAWIFGQRFGGALNLAGWLDPTRWSIVTRIVLEQFGPTYTALHFVGMGLAALGLIVLIRQSWRVALITLVAFAGYFFYGLVYQVPDVDVFIIPAYLLLAIWLGVALAFIVRLVSRLALRASPDGQRVALTALYLVFALFPLWQMAGNFSLINQRGLDADQEAWGRYVLSLPIPDRAALLVDSEKIAPLYYLQVTEHLRPDLDILVLGDEALYRQELDRRIGEGQPVYLARFLPNLPYRLRSLGPLVEVSPEPLSAAPPLGQEIAASFGNQIKLLGVTTEAGNPYRITLAWQALSPERPNYHVRLRLVDAQGKVWWEDAGAHPVGGYYPTGAWAQHEVVSDFHEVPLEPFLPPGTYDLEVGLFTPFRSDGLAVNGGDWLKVSSVPIGAPQPEPLQRDVRQVFDQTVVTSVDELGTAPPGSPVTLRLNVSGADARATLALVQAGATSGVATATATLTQTLRAGQNRVQFTAPELEGAYEVILAAGAPARCHWLAGPTPDCALGTLQVEGEAAGDAINFENQVLLMKSNINQNNIQPGEALRVDLTWRGLKTWPDDYTAFVHLLGPDGKVHGQVDQWPVEGTLPTSSWTAGQVVDDPVVVTLPPDAPGGKYQVEVGWYLLSTLRRLNVLDSAGRPSDDHVIVGEFVVP